MRISTADYLSRFFASFRKSLLKSTQFYVILIITERSVCIKGAKQHENNRATAQRTQARNDGKML